MQPMLSAVMHRDCKDKIREVAGEALQRLVKFLGPMYAAQGESLRSKAAAALGNLAADSDANAQAITQLGGPSTTDGVPSLSIKEPGMSCATTAWQQFS